VLHTIQLLDASLRGETREAPRPLASGRSM
jgi:hypothetical protein